MDTGWSRRGHTVHRATHEFYWLPQLLFLLLFGNMNPSGISLSAAESQMGGSTSTDLPRYWPRVCDGKDAPAPGL